MQTDITFHATEDDIVSWITKWMPVETSTFVFGYFPFSIRRVESIRIENAIRDVNVKRMAFVPSHERNTLPNSESSFNDFFPNRLTLDIGRESADGMEECWLCAYAKDRSIETLWRRLINSVTGNTRAGVSLVSLVNGKSMLNGKHRYSTNAMNKSQSGVKMLTI